MPEKKFEKARNFAKRRLPESARRMLRAIINRALLYKRNLRLAFLRRCLFSESTRAIKVQTCLGHTVRFVCGEDFYAFFRDIIINRIYHFQPQRLDPLIIDCGSNIGVSIIYFKHAYPRARIIGFEPDPAIFAILKENVEANRLNEVKLVQAALAAQEGTLTFYSDGKCGRLRDYLTEPVDFLKVNIEGGEWEVLADSEDRLRLVREMVVEYHHTPGLERRLHKILELLHRCGFDYLINDFDPEANHAVHPPFNLTPETRYCLLIYAKRLDPRI